MGAYPIYLRRLLVLVAVLALGLRSLVPAGYMPDFSGHGALVVCDGVHHTGDGHANHSHGGHDSPCPFSEGTVYSLQEFTPPAFIPVVVAFTELLPPVTPLLNEHRAFSNTSPRSPPQFS